MSCRIQFTEKGKINKVFTPNGEESLAYRKLSSLPFNTMESALEVYKQGIDSNDISFTSNGEVYNTYKEALINSNGADIVVNGVVDGGIIELQKVSSNTNPKNKLGFINNGIKSGVLSDETIYEDGETYLKAEGFNEIFQMANEQVLSDMAYENGHRLKVSPDGKLSFSELLKTSDYQDRMFSEVSEEMGEERALNVLGLSGMLSQLFKRKPSQNNYPVSDSSIIQKLQAALEKAGFSIQGMEEYKSNYNKKNEVEPSAEMLVDIANKVVAVSDGALTSENLTEELTHFLLEQLDSSEIDDATRNVIYTEEYTQFANRYREVYSQDESLSAEAVEVKVRKEILGKIVAKGIVNQLREGSRSESIFTYLLNKIRDFLSNLGIGTNVGFQRQVEGLVKEMTNKIVNQNISDVIKLDDASAKRYVYYSLSMKPSTPTIGNINDELKVILTTLRDQESTLRRGGSNRQAIQEVLDKLLNVDAKMSILSTVDFAYKQLEYLERAVEESKSRGETLSSEEMVVLASLKEQVLPAIGVLNSTIKDDKTLSRLTPNLNDLTSRINNLQAMPTQDIVSRIAKRAIDRHQIPDKVKVGGVEYDTLEYLTGTLQEASKDTNFIYSYIGQISHAQEPLLNMLDFVISDMVARARDDFFVESKDFQTRLEKLGVKNIGKFLPKFYEKNGYMLSLWDFKKFDDDVLKSTAKVFYKHLKAQKSSKGESMSLTEDKILEMLKNGEQFEKTDRLENSFKDEYSKELSSELGKLRERQYTDSYYEDREAELAGLNIPEEALKRLREISFDRMDIMSRVDMSSGYPVFTLQDKYDLDSLNQVRTRAKALYDDEGVRKQGLVVMTEREFKKAYPNEFQENKYVYDNGFVKSGSNYIALDASKTPSAEAKVAYGLTKVDGNFLERMIAKGVRPTGLTAKFKDQLKNIENTQGREAAYNFFTANVNLAMDDSFYQREREDIFESFLDSGESTAEFEEAYDEYLDLHNSRRELLKQYRDTKNTMNTLGDKMSPNVQERVRELSLLIREKKRVLHTLIGEKSSFELEDGLESNVNESYLGELRDLGIAEDLTRRLEFTMKHVIDPISLLNFNTSLDYLKGSRMPSEFYQNSLDKVLLSLGTSTQQLFEEVESITANTVSLQERREQIDALIDGVKVSLAEQRLAPYFKTVAPEGMTDTLSEMMDKNSTKTIHSLVEELESLGLKMNLHQSYYQMTADPQLNSKYKKGFTGSKYQPKNSYLNTSNFESKLGVRLLRDSEGNVIFDEAGIPEVENETLDFKVWKEVIQFKAGTLDKLNETKAHNLYLAPQVSRTNIDKFTQIVRGKSGKKEIAKELIKEMLTFRVDEQEQGQTAEDGVSLFQRSGLRVIPKRYINRLEKVEDVTDDLFYSLLLQRQEANLYQSRQQSLMELTALENTIAEKRYKNGKKSISTNTYKMTKSFIDYNLYGIQEVVNWRVQLPIIGQVDVAKLGRMLHKYVRFRNLAFNLPIPITSWLTAEAGIQLERWVGQYIDPHSLNLARKEFRKLSIDSARQAFNPQRKSKLDLLGQYFGVFDIDRSYENSKFSRKMIALGKVDMGLHTMGNYSPVSQSMLSMLIGHRLYNGRLVEKGQFKQQYRMANPSKSSKEVENAWKELKTKSMYSYILTEEGEASIKFDIDRLMKDSGTTLSKEEFTKEFNQDRLAIDAKIRKFVERIDGNIPQHEKTMLQRNFIGAFTMTHKGWLSIATANRFKSSHFNLQTGQIEEGSYITLARKLRMVADSLTDAVKQKSFKPFYDALLDTYRNADTVERANLQRIAKDQALVLAMYGIVLALSSLADDDDNKDLYVAQMTSYIADRVFNETKSVQFGVFNELYKSAKEPLVGTKQLEDLFTFWRVLDGTEITRGNYRGLTVREKYFIDNVPGFKSTYSIMSGENIFNQRNSYIYFNKRDDMNPASLIISSKDFKEWVKNKEDN